jgi:hypothetical protein
VRVLLILLIVNGLVPSLGETVAAIALARAEHVEHGRDGAGAPCDDSRERGCTTTEHHCACCAGMPVLPRPGLAAALTLASAGEAPAALAEGPSTRSLEPPYRPPIA